MEGVVFPGEGAVIFNPASWETQLFNESAFRILQALRSKPQRAQELVALLAGDEPSASGVEAGQVLAALAEMESLGLLTRAPARP